MEGHKTYLLFFRYLFFLFYFNLAFGIHSIEKSMMFLSNVVIVIIFINDISLVLLSDGFSLKYVNLGHLIFSDREHNYRRMLPSVLDNKI